MTNLFQANPNQYFSLIGKSVNDELFQSFQTEFESDISEQNIPQGKIVLYKEKGIYFTKIDQYYASSKTCHSCHYKADKLPLNIRQWQCPCCGENHDRDINAAKNIRSEGIKQIKAKYGVYLV